MKVLHVTQNYYPSRGGTQHTMQHVSEYLARHYQDQVFVYTTNSYYGPNRKRFKKIELKEEQINGVLVKRFPFIKAHKPFIRYYSLLKSRLLNGKAGDFLTGLNSGPLSPGLKYAMLQTDADVICASSMHYLFADYPFWPANPLKPFVLYGALHVKQAEEISPQYLKRIRQADFYLANTSFEKEYLVRRGIDDNKIVVTGAATDVFKYDAQLDNAYDLRLKYQLEKDVKLVLCLCRHEASKNIEWLLDAYRSLQQQGQQFTLLVAGAKGGYTDHLLSLCRQDNNIKILFDITDKEKCELLKMSDMVVLPSVAESFGVVFLEAWSYHKPVIGANIGAVASVIDHEVDGLLFEPGNTGNLAFQIKALLDDPVLCNCLGNEGYNKIMKYYTWPVVTSAFRKTYEMAIELKRKK